MKKPSFRHSHAAESGGGGSGSGTGGSRGSIFREKGRLDSVFFSSSPAQSSSSWKMPFGSNPLEYLRSSQQKRKTMERRQSTIASQISQLTKALDAPESSLYGSNSRKRRRNLSRILPFQSLKHESSELLIDNNMLEEPNEQLVTKRPWERTHARLGGAVLLLYFSGTLLAVIVSLIAICFPTSIESEANRDALHAQSRAFDVLFACKLYADIFHRRHRPAGTKSTANVYALMPRLSKANILRRRLLLEAVLALPIMSLGLERASFELIRLGAAARLLAVVPALQKEGSIYNMIDRAFGSHRGITRRVVRILLRLLLLGFFLSVLFFSVSYVSMTPPEAKNEGVWSPDPVASEDISDVKPFRFDVSAVETDILTSMYFVIQTLLTVGYGDVVPGNLRQIQFVMACIVCAVGVHALLIAHMTALLKNLNETTTHFKHQMDLVARYLKARRIGPEVQTKVASYFNFLWDRQRGRLEADILGPLPPILRDMISRGRRSSLLHIPMFQERDMAFVDAVVTSLEPQIVNFGEFLCLRGDPVDAMWILGEGKLEILSAGRGDGFIAGNNAANRQISRKPSGLLAWAKLQQGPTTPKATPKAASAPARVVETVYPGPSGFYGEEILFSTSLTHKYSVRAARVCEVQRLDAEAFLFVLSLYGAYTPGANASTTPVSSAVSEPRSETSADAQNASRGSVLGLFSTPSAQSSAASGLSAAGGDAPFKLQRAQFGRGGRRNRSSMVSAEVLQDAIAPQASRGRMTGALGSRRDAPGEPIHARGLAGNGRDGGSRSSPKSPLSRTRTATRFLNKKLTTLASSTLTTKGFAKLEVFTRGSKSVRHAGETGSQVVWHAPVPQFVGLASAEQARSVEARVRDTGVVRSIQEWRERQTARSEKARKATAKRAFTMRALSMTAKSAGRFGFVLTALDRFLGLLLSVVSTISESRYSHLSWNLLVIFAHLTLCVLPTLDLVVFAIDQERVFSVGAYLAADVIVLVNVLLQPKFVALSTTSGPTSETASGASASGNDDRAGGAGKAPGAGETSASLESGFGLASVWDTLKSRGSLGVVFYALLFLINASAYALRSDMMNVWILLRLTSITLFWPLGFEEIHRFGYRFEWFRQRSALQIVALNVAMAIAAMVHWSSCVYARLELHSYPIPLAQDLEDATLTISVRTRYWHSFYWTLITMTTVGYGDIVPRDDYARVFALIVMIAGVLLYAGFISIVAAITRSSSGADHRFEQFEDCCKHYLTQRDLPRKLMSDCHAYLEYLEEHQQRLEELDMLTNDFPQSLEDCIREEILGESFFGADSIFAGLPKDFVRDLQRRMRKEVFLPGHVITCGFSRESGQKQELPENRGVTDAMLFLEEGQAEILCPAGDGKPETKMGILGSGRAFAMIALFEPALQQHELRAKTTCEVWLLTARDLAHCVSEHERVASDGRKSPTTSRSTGPSQGPPSPESDENETNVRDFVYNDVRQRAMDIAANTANVAKNLANAKLNKLMKSSRHIHESAHDWGVILPTSRMATAWSIFMSNVTVYNVLATTFRVGVSSGWVSDQALAFTVCDAISDWALLANVLLRARCFAVEVNGILMTRREAIGRVYRATDLRKDVVFSLPLALLARLGKGSGHLEVQIYAALRFNAGLMMYRMPEWTSTMAALIGPRHRNAATLVALFLLILLSAHISGCLFLGIARWNLARGSATSWATNSWEGPLLERNGTEGMYEVMDAAYAWSVYWAVTTLTTVGYGDYAAVKDSEMAYTLLLLLCGGFLYALILNNLEEIIAQSDNCSILFQRKVDAMGNYMTTRQLPKSVVHQVTSYYNTLWVRQKGVEEAWIQDRLPLSLRRAIRADAIGSRGLKQFPLFSAWGELESLLDLLRPSMVMDDRVLFMEGQLIYKCYFIAQGKVEYVSSDGKQVCTSFAGGDSFGELQFFFNEPTECIARTCERTDLLVLHRTDFDIFVRERPALAERFGDDLAAIESDLRKRVSLEAFTRNLGKSKVNKLFSVDTEVHIRPLQSLWTGEKLLAPHNVYRRLWNLFMLIALLYNFLAGLFRVSFLRVSVVQEDGLERAFKNYLPFDIIADLIFVLDAIFHATLFAAVKPTGIVWERRRVRAQFMKWRLVVYVLALLPGDYAVRWGAFKPLVGSLYTPAGEVAPYVIALGRLSRLFMLPRMPSLEQSAQSLVEERGVVVSSGNKQIIRLVFRAMLAAHLMACAKCALSVRYLEILHSGFSAVEAYAVCLYWAMYTIATVGYGNIHVDAPVFAIMCIILGNFLCDAGVTATVSNILSNRESKLSDAKRHRVALMQYMKSHRIDAETRLEVLDYMDYRVSTLKSLDEGALLDEANVPPHIRAQIATIIALRSSPHLVSHPMFKGFSLGLIQTMALMLSPVVLARGHQLIWRSASLASDAYHSTKAAKARRLSRPSEASSDEPGGPPAVSRAGLKYVSQRTYGLSVSPDGAGSSKYPKRKMHEMPEVASLDFLRQANLDDPSKSLHLASHANIGWQRYPASADEDNLYFLVSGSVRVSAGLVNKTVRRGLICRASGIDGAVATTHCEVFVLEVSQFRVLAQYSTHIGNGVYADFMALLRDPEGHSAVEEYLHERKSGEYVADVRFWRACEMYEASPSQAAAEEIVNTFVVPGSKTSLDFGSLGDAMQAQLSQGQTRDMFLQAKRDVYRRLELVVKPRFLASAEFVNLLLRKADDTLDHSEKDSSSAAEPKHVSMPENEPLLATVESLIHEPVTQADEGEKEASAAEDSTTDASGSSTSRPERIARATSILFTLPTIASEETEQVGVTPLLADLSPRSRSGSRMSTNQAAVLPESPQALLTEASDDDELDILHVEAREHDHNEEEDLH